MKQKLLLTLFIASINLAVNAQKTTTYAITGSQKGQNNWTEVRLVDVTSGQELKTIFKNSEETQPLNARTGKPVVKKDLKPENLQVIRYTPDGNVITISGDNVRIDTRKAQTGLTATTIPDVPVVPSVKGLHAAKVSNEKGTEYVITGDNVRIVSGKPEPVIATTVISDHVPFVRSIKIKDGKPAEEVIDKIVLEREAALSSKLNVAEVSKLKEATRDKVLIETYARTATARPEVIVHTNVNTNVNVNTNINTVRNVMIVKDIQGKIQTEVLMRLSPALDKPFSTYSAACAYDKKHERLYYTPMGIAQLRYIDLKSKTPQVYYFEDEQFGALRHRGDVPNQITRMVIGADGKGYALTNNAEHLIQFTTDKKATITDLGSLTDDPSNGKYTVHSPAGYGGDIIAAKSGDLYLIMANHNIFQIDIKSMVAKYKGTIEGLPRGYSTNGAAVEEGTMVLVNSSNSTEGYYHFDINKLVAEKVSTSTDVYNASDLANANLLTVKKDKKDEQVLQEVAPVPEIPEPIAQVENSKEKIMEDNIQETRLGVYPNPVANGIVNLLLDNYSPGKYLAKLIDVSGKQLNAKNFTVHGKKHSEPFTLPATITKGNYLIQIYDQSTKAAGIVKLIVQ